MRIKNQNGSLFTLLVHFPSNQALVGNNPQKADYTGKKQQLSDHTSSPGKPLHRGKRQCVCSTAKWEFPHMVAWN